MAKNDGKLILFVILTLILSSGVFAFVKKVDREMEQLAIASAGQALFQRILQTNYLVIDDSSGQIKDIGLQLRRGATAFDLLKQGAQYWELELKTETYEDMGVFVEAIGDRKNGQDGKFWLYYVNDKMPSVAADKQLLTEGDKVEFKFEESPF